MRTCIRPDVFGKTSRCNYALELSEPKIEVAEPKIEVASPTSEAAASTRTFSTGAMRNSDAGKFDYEGFLSPLVIERFGEYMNKHRKMEDGSLRDSDNWQHGIPKDQYMKSAWRHFFDIWKEHRGIPSKEGLQDACCALLFNIMGYLHETLKEKK